MQMALSCFLSFPRPLSLLSPRPSATDFLHHTGALWLQVIRKFLIQAADGALQRAPLFVGGMKNIEFVADKALKSVIPG